MKRARSASIAEVHRLPAGAAWSDARVVAAISEGTPGAAAILFDRYGADVERLLWSVLGPAADVEDVLHEVFVRALEGIGRLEDPARLKGWLVSTAVYTAKDWIRARARRRWLLFCEAPPEPLATTAPEEVSEALWCTFRVLEEMAPEARIYFSLRFVEGMELAEVALACDVSMSTAKRRLKDAQKQFLARARRFEVLRTWIETGARREWGAD